MLHNFVLVENELNIGSNYLVTIKLTMQRTLLSYST